MEKEPIKSHEDLEVYKEEIIHAVIRSPQPIPSKSRRPDGYEFSLETAW